MFDIEEWGKSGVKGLFYILFGGKMVFVGYKIIFFLVWNLNGV